MRELGSRSLNALFWGTGGTIVRIVLQFVTQVMLARILGPDQYGLFAIGAIVIGFSNFFADVGIAYGLIQKEIVNSKDVRFVFTWQIIIGSIVAISVGLASTPIASFFGDERARDVVQGLAGICLLNALAAPSLNLLKRELDFKRIQYAQIVSYVIGYVFVGLPVAFNGGQVWALVIAWLVQSLVMLIMLYDSTRHAVTPLFWYPDARKQSVYGVTVLTTNIINWMINNIDRVIVGRMFPSSKIGLYAMGYNMLYNPTSSLLGIIQPVFFSASSRIVDDNERISKIYLGIIGAIALFILPVFVAVASVSETFILALYGDAWREAAIIFQPLALAMPFFLVWGMTTPLLWTGGSPASEFKTQLPVLALWVIVTWFAAQISLAAVGWAVFTLFGARCGVIFYVASCILSISWFSVWRAVRRGVAISMTCSVAVVLADITIRQLVDSCLFWLMADVITGVSVFFAAVTWWPGTVNSELMNLIKHTAKHCPAPVAQWLYLVAGEEAGRTHG